MSILINIIEVLSIIILFSILFYQYYKSTKFKKVSESQDLNRLFKIYNIANEIIKISNCDFVALFRYKSSKNKRFIETHFQFSLDKDGLLQHESVCGDLPASFNSFSLNVIKYHDNTLHELYKGTISDSENLREIYKNTFKVYFTNLYKDNDVPIGYITLSYSHEYKMSEEDNSKIVKLIKDIKKIL